MSGRLALSAAINVAEIAVDILFRIPRGLASPSSFIVPDCAVEETSRDDLQITEHPVEFGSVIADHAFKKPREVTLRWSWSNTGNYGTFMQDVFLQLTTIQSSRQPCYIYTGKTQYANMLIASLGVTTNSESEYVLNAIMVCREVIIVSTQATGPTTAPQAAQANPSATAPVQQLGTVNLLSGSALA